MLSKLCITLSLSLLSITGIADPLKLEIKQQAQDILDAIDSSTASSANLDLAIDKLHQVKRLLRGGNNGGNALFCEPRSSSYSYVTRTRDGTRLSDEYVSNATCQDIIQKTKNGLVCAPRSSSYAHVVDIQSTQIIGTDYVSFQTCFDLIEDSTPKLVCGPRSSSYSHVYRIRDQTILGSDYVANSICTDIIRNSTRDLVCAPRSSSYAYITRIDDGTTIGDYLNTTDCFSRIQP